MDITVGPNGYGALSGGLKFKLPSGYVTIVGENNVGKSTLLQWIFREILDSAPQDENVICYIPKHRDFITSTSQSSTELKQKNRDLKHSLDRNPLAFSDPNAYLATDLYSIIVNEHSTAKQIDAVEKLLSDLNLGEYRSAGRGTHFLDNVNLISHGSGVRNLMPVIAAITHPSMKYVIIDEPEVSLEASKQKAIKKHLMEFAKGNDKTVILATHSHLFLNTENPSNNIVLRKNGDKSEVEFVKEKNMFYEVAFQMLGHSLSDLFLPDNYMLVEGGSDQIIAQKIYELIRGKHKDREIRILSCTGLSNVAPTAAAIRHTFLPIFEGLSPYSKTTIALIDKLRTGDKEHKKIHEILEKTFKDTEGRLFILNEDSLEKYLPEELYKKAGMVKTDEVEKVNTATTDTEKDAIKKVISNKIAAIVSEEDLELLPHFLNAVESALKKAV